MSTRYLAEIIPPADTAVEAFETVVDEEEEEAEVGIISSTFQKNERKSHFPEFVQGHGDGPTCSFRQRAESQLLGEILNIAFLSFAPNSPRA